MKSIDFELNDVCVGPEVSISEVIKCIDRCAVQISMVVDSEGKLLGTVTDGDIRRALLSHVSLEKPVSFIMNKDPFTGYVNQSEEELILLMEDKFLSQVPIIDDTNKVVDLKTLHSLLSCKSSLCPVFIMAGGFGKRLMPITKSCPKPMLHVGDQPILESIITSFAMEGFKNIFISVHYLAEKIINYFGDGAKWGVNIKYIKEEKPLGTAGALAFMRNNFYGDKILVMNADIITDIKFERLLDYHAQCHSAITACVRKYSFQVPYGVIEGKNYMVSHIEEKPRQDFFVNAGIYLINKEVLKLINTNIYTDMPELISLLLKRDEKIAMFPLHEQWIDIGHKEQYNRMRNNQVI